MNAKFERAERHFSSLEECVNYIKLHYDPGATIRVQTKDIESDEMVPLDVTAYLYRGEKGSFPSTTSSMSRMKGDTLLSKHTREVIENVALKLDSGLQEFMQFNQMYSSGFLQHYGAPTELLDITSDLKVAAFFASEGRAGDTGLMCTFPVAVISKNSVTIDLREHPGAERPRRQSAFGFFNRKYVDIKDQKCIQELQLHWFSFTLQQTDKSLYHSDGHLLDAHTDKVAGMLQLLIDDFDKFDDAAATWLSNKIVPAPFVTIAKEWYSPGQPKVVELVPLSETGIPYDEEKERVRNHEKWSDKSPETREHMLEKKLGHILRSIYPHDQVLHRLEANWPADNSVDFLVPSHKIAFLYGSRPLSADPWCHQHHYQLINIADPHNLTEDYVRSAVETILRGSASG